ncbi:uncharacterized protein BO95DRAFT_440366 [Aspergillus brunneoviolaceus CBS 621.78]|uniref:Uncharacterized protein n=1 Tax=Aspergillus brunneoviolaceus CBS 621.78 TaxID=1450534 RepID=A0ACD1GH46_9EURO|nr:hypothetical protein BO95DRAFT_440366 [Aspergillus brunneoviolaceus CBS 621.78]RAH48557.1 hypothetical protein BO95DRAFT_440366 [Aspergillus brunneoviolaceus CBS 621.78]
MSINNSGLSPRILRFPRSDEPKACVLLHVTRRGPSALDLDLVGTEGECPFTGAVRQSHLNSYRSKNYQGTEDDWTRIILHVLGQAEQCGKEQDLLAGLEALAIISGSEIQDKEIKIVIRKRVQTITQKFGTLVLKQNDEQTIHLYDWTSISAERAGFLERRCSGLLDRYRAAEQTIKDLDAQLNELIGAKTRHEELLMNNLMQLLNEKKLKIRNQQRVIATTEVAPEQEFRTQETQPGGSRQTTAAKRRANGSASTPSYEVWGSGTGLEDSEDDRAKRHDSSKAVSGTDSGTDNEPPLMHRPSGEEDESTTDEDMPPLPSHDPRISDSGPQQTHSQSISKKHLTPQRRELPFPRTRGNATATVRIDRHESKEAKDNMGETDDDEL